MSTRMHITDLNGKLMLDIRLTTTTLTGHLILFVDVCTNFVHSEVEELSGYAFGGNSYSSLTHLAHPSNDNRVIIHTSMM